MEDRCPWEEECATERNWLVLQYTEKVHYKNRVNMKVILDGPVPPNGAWFTGRAKHILRLKYILGSD